MYLKASFLLRLWLIMCTRGDETLISKIKLSYPFICWRCREGYFYRKWLTNEQAPIFILWNFLSSLLYKLLGYENSSVTVFKNTLLTHLMFFNKFFYFCMKYFFYIYIICSNSKLGIRSPRSNECLHKTNFTKTRPTSNACIYTMV